MQERGTVKHRAFFSRLRFLFAQAAYDLGTGLLFRPLVITVALAVTAVILLNAESAHEDLLRAASRHNWLLIGDAGAAQIVLGTIAASTMTVVAVVFSVIVMALTLASTQFSPRILRGLMKDRAGQNTMGIFVGTFIYSLLALGSIRGGPDPFVPSMASGLAMILGLACLLQLLYFIHHISEAIQVNTIVDAIAGDTEKIVEASFPERDAEREGADAAPAERSAEESGRGKVLEVRAEGPGYIQLIDYPSLEELARAGSCSLHIPCAPGDFVVKGEVLARLSCEEPAAPEDLADPVREAFDIGRIRTMQQDVAFGIRQIVDIGLKAISPAVNDPSTAVTCIDHLGRIMSLVARRGDPRSVLRDSKGRCLLVHKVRNFETLLDLSFNQIRQYGKRDIAVALRTLKALITIASATDEPDRLKALERHARVLHDEVRGSFHPEDMKEFEARLSRLEELIERPGSSPAGIPRGRPDEPREAQGKVEGSLPEKGGP